MAICPPKKIDSNITGLRYAEERCLGELPALPIWMGLEPNSYSDFGGQLTTVARNPINPSRQQKKGVVTDLDASGGFNQDLTIGNTTDLMQGFLFADARQRAATTSLANGIAIISGVVGSTKTFSFNNVKVASAVVAVGGTGYRVGDLITVTGAAQRSARLYVAAINTSTGAVTALSVDDSGVYASLPANPAATTGGTGSGCTVTLTGGDVVPAFVSGDLVLAEGFAAAANNGIKNVASYTTGALVVAETSADETPSGAKLTTVGHKFAAADISIVMNGKLPRLTSAAYDMSTLGLIPGEWIYIDGLTNNVGFARVSAIDPDYLELDKVDWPNPVAEAGTGKTVSVYFGILIRNESDASMRVQKYGMFLSIISFCQQSVYNSQPY